ncbi:hypothetical protein HK101_005910, partial [Irineochytrium annulatum]
QQQPRPLPPPPHIPPYEPSSPGLPAPTVSPYQPRPMPPPPVHQHSQPPYMHPPPHQQQPYGQQGPAAFGGYGIELLRYNLNNFLTFVFVTSAPQQPPSPYAPHPAAPAKKPTDHKVIETASKHSRFAISALQYEDIPTAIDYLEKALALLRSQ